MVAFDGDSVIGQLIGVSSEEDLQIIEAMGWLFGGFFISQGEGAQLDGAGEWLNVTRYSTATPPNVTLTDNAPMLPGNTFPAVWAGLEYVRTQRAIRVSPGITVRVASGKSVLTRQQTNEIISEEAIAPKKTRWLPAKKVRGDQWIAGLKTIFLIRHSTLTPPIKTRHPQKCRLQGSVGYFPDTM